MDRPEFGNILEALKRSMFKEFCIENEVPEDIWLLADSLIEAGCPVEKVCDGMVKFAEKMAFRELVDGLPVETFGYKKKGE